MASVAARKKAGGAGTTWLAVHQLTHAAFLRHGCGSMRGCVLHASRGSGERRAQSSSGLSRGSSRGLQQAEKDGCTAGGLRKPRRGFLHSKARWFGGCCRPAGDGRSQACVAPVPRCGRQRRDYFEHLIEAESKRDLGGSSMTGFMAMGSLPDFISNRRTRGSRTVPALLRCDRGERRRRRCGSHGNNPTNSGDFPAEAGGSGEGQP